MLKNTLHAYLESCNDETLIHWIEKNVTFPSCVVDRITPRAPDSLADEIKTSDELLAERSKDRDIFRVSYKFKKSFQKKFLASIDGVIVKFTDVRCKKWFESRLPR